MTALLTLLLLLANPAPSSLDQVKSEPNAERRARAAIDFAGVAEKNAEVAYVNADLPATDANLQTAADSIELAHQSFLASGKTPGRNPGPYKYAEQRTRELLVRINDLNRRMDSSERTLIESLRVKIQEIHDEWFEGIMGKKR